MRRSSRHVFGVIIVVFLLALPCVGQGQLVLYDDFRGPGINPQKWHGTEGDAGPSAPNAEAVRQITRGKLRLFLTRYGGTDSDSGDSPRGTLRLRINNSTPVTTVQAQVIVTQALTEGCPANATPSQATARIGGHFFNDGSSGGPGDSTGDILVHFFKIRLSTGDNRITAAVARCANPECSVAPFLVSRNFTTTWTMGGADTLRLQWDPDNDRFLFAVNPSTPREETAVLSYSISDVHPAAVDQKELRVQNRAANCTAGQKQASMDALFDDVFTNVAPPPSGPTDLLTILPASDALLTTQGFDLSLILQASGRSIVGGRATFNGTDVTTALVRCIIPGTLLTGGQTFRCPGLTGGLFGPGMHTFNVILNLSDGSSLSNTARWEVLDNTEP